MRTVIRRYDPLQLRDPDGKWGDGVPGPSTGFFDMAGFDNVVEIEGTFGDLAMGTDEVGDVRLAFRDNGQVVEMDLGGEDIAGLGDALEELADARRELPDDAEPRGVYDDRRFGFEDSHKVELLGNGQIVVTFGAEEDDPATLLLDPPDDGDEDVEATDDAADLIAAIDEVLAGGDVDRAVVERKYNASQIRDLDGQWSDGTPSPLSDPLRLADRIRLDPGETYLGSARVDADQGGIRMALTDRGGRRMLRLGAGGEGYGQRDRDNGIAAWDGNPAREPLPEAERQRLEAERDALEDEWDTATPERQAEINARTDDLREQLNETNSAFAGTASLDEYSWRRIADRIRPALQEAIEQHRTENAAWDEIEKLEAAGDFDPARMAELRRIARADDAGYITFTEGIVPGSEWGDVHFRVEMDDDEPYVMLGVAPKGAPDNWGDDQDWMGVFDPAETRKFFRLLDKLTADTQRSRSPENGDAPPAGGQFAPGGGRVGGKGKKPPARRRRPAKPAASAGPLSFDGKSGTGYGIKGGDGRVRTLQAALTRLGITDSDGQELAPDGRYGPRTTSAVKKLQKALGLEADGKATPELLKRVAELKQLPAAKPHVPAKKRPPTGPRTPRKQPTASRRSLLAIVNRALRLGVEVRHQQLFDRTYVLDDIQIQRSGDGRTVEAYAAMFGTPYEVRDAHGHYMEVIDRSAFNRTLSNGAGRQALCLYNHGMSVVDGKPDPMAQIPIGTPLEIRADGRGLLTVTRYNKGDYADSLLEAIRNGAIRSQSFRGRIVRSSPDRVPLRSRSGGLPTITRHELGLSDYGPTPIPVNAGAEIMAVRSLTELAQDFAALDDDGRLELLRTLGIDPDGDDTEGTSDTEPVEETTTAPDEGDDTPTSAEGAELGAEDPPILALRSASHISRRIRAAMIQRGMA